MAAILQQACARGVARMAAGVPRGAPPSYASVMRKTPPSWIAMGRKHSTVSMDTAGAIDKTSSFDFETLSRASTDVDQLFEAIDTDASGQIDRDEFRAAMKLIGTEQLLALQMALPRAELSATRSDNVAAGDRGFGAMFASRLVVTAEVMVSKIFPAGFGWQYASCLAGNDLGLAADSMSFAVVTGVGDGLGVFLGHTLYCTAKSAFVKEIDPGQEAQTGWLLGTAAFCSGTAWQPTVDMLTASGMHFSQVACGTTVICGAFFYSGLRLGRWMYSRVMSGVEGNNYSNLQADALLSISVGGATGAFVGTDCAQVGNWLMPYFGIADGTADLAGAAIAGSSTATGFAVLQTAENALITDGKNWVD